VLALVTRVEAHGPELGKVIAAASIIFRGADS
jgi:hypothetical protein